MNELDDKVTNISNTLLNKPDFLAINGCYFGGPFYIANHSFTTVKPISFTCQQSEKTAFNLNIAPLWKNTDGSTTNASLLIDDLSVIDSSSLSHQLSLQGSLMPGLYHSHLTITHDANTHSIPVSVRISAHWIWIVIFLLLGLVSFGIGQYLAGEQALYEKRKEILELRQTFSEFRDQNQTAIAEHTLTSNIDELFSTALHSLGKSRPIGLKDTRIEKAEYYTTEALNAIKEVHKKLDGKPLGEIELTRLKNRWLNLLSRSNEIEKLLTKQGDDYQKPLKTIAAVAAQLETKMIGQFVTPSIITIRENLSVQVGRAKLIYSTGQIDRARHFSRKVEIWLQRAASQLEKDFNLILTWRETFRSFILLEFQVGNALEDPVFNKHKVIKEKFNKANRIIELQPDLIAIRDAHKIMQETLTDIMQVRADKLLEELNDAIKQIKKVTNLNSIDHIFSTAPKDNSPEVKRKTLLKVLAEWNSISDGFISPETQKAAKTKIEKIRQLIKAGDFTAADEPYKQLISYWEKDFSQRVANVIVRLLKPYCMNVKKELEQTIISTEIATKQMQPHPEVAKVDEDLDRLALKLKQTPGGMECLNYLLEVGEKVLTLNNKVFNIGLMVVEIRAEDKVEAAKRSGLDESLTLMKQLMREPWPIIVNYRTSGEEHFVDRNLVIAIDNLKQSWRAGTLISIDFGDGTPLLYRKAEKVRAAGVISHRYAHSGNFTIQITALTDRESNEILGEGFSKIIIDPSPASAASQLAGMFLNLRFLLSLVIALLIQVWKPNREMPFGSYGRDYIEAFAIGVGSNAGMEGVTVLLKTITG